jgi:hypothetical protein
MMKHSWQVQLTKEVGQQGKSSRVQEVDQPFVDQEVDDGLHSHEL